MACIREKCRDPCPGSCGIEARCNVINHTPICTCPEGYTGDPFTNCFPKPPRKWSDDRSVHSSITSSTDLNFETKNIKCIIKYSFLAVEPVEADDPCNPSPCGPNAECNNGICTCLPEYQGDPYRGCRPECVLNNDCPRDKACIRNKCLDPCPGTCGQNALCDVINHIPVCRCPDKMSGNPFVQCAPVPGN